LAFIVGNKIDISNVNYFAKPSHRSGDSY